MKNVVLVSPETQVADLYNLKPIPKKVKPVEEKKKVCRPSEKYTNFTNGNQIYLKSFEISAKSRRRCHVKTVNSKRDTGNF